MDDLFFSDTPKRNDPLYETGPDSFRLDDTPADAFSGNELPDTGKKKFVVHLPREDAPVAQDRSPQGRPVVSQPRRPAPPAQQHRPRQQEARQPQQRADWQTPQMPQYTPAKEPQRTTASIRPQAVSRTPQGRPIGSDNYTRRAPSPAPKQPPRKKKGKVGLKIALVLVILLVLAIGAVAAFGFSSVGKLTFDKDFKDTNAYINESELASSASVKNILFIGSDAREDMQGQRSDTMLICSVDKRHHQVKLTSFLRDSYVYIPSKGYSTKLNAAFSYGGAQLLTDTIEYNFKVKIDDYVLIDFVGFTKMIDALGGLDVDGVTEAEAKYLRDVVKIVYAKEGKNHFSGAASLWYCRIRKLDDDFHRTERQRKVINAILNQALHTSPAKLLKAIDKVLPYITTSMDRSAVVPLVMSTVINYIGKDNPQQQIPAEGTWSDARVGGAAVLKLDLEENTSILKKFIYG